MTASMTVLDDAAAASPSAASPMLTSTLLTTLDRPPHPTAVASPLRGLVAGLLTAGLWPAFADASRLHGAARWREQAIEHVADWTRLEVGTEAAAPLDPLAGDRVTRTLAVAAGVSAALATLAAVLHVAGGGGITRLWLVDPFRGGEPGLPQLAFLGLLGLSFALTWLAANLHLRRGVRFARAAETAIVGDSDALPRWRRPPRWEYGLGVLSTTLGATLAFFGVTWALPMVVAGVAARRVVLVGDRAILSGLAVLARFELGRRRPILATPAPIDRVRTCAYDGCDARIAPDGRFCPRCGRRT